MRIESEVFYDMTKDIAQSLQRIQADPETIYKVGHALESEFKRQFGKRFRLLGFYEEAGLR